jgi:hypothetical protein
MELLHKLWLDLSDRGLGHMLHHRDVVRIALRRLESALKSDESKQIIGELQEETSSAAKQPNGKSREMGPGPQSESESVS